MSKPNIFFQLTKVDVAKRTVEGIATAEQPDKSGEICDYFTTKPFYQKWSDGIKKASGGKSLGNVRAMHGNIAAGKVTELLFDDVQKAIRIVAKIVDDAEWKKVAEGVYTGFSQGGEYIKRWADGDYTRYTADPSEVSIVDNPCLAAASFEVVKADGTVSMQKFHTKTPTVEQKWETTDGKTFEKKADAIAHQGQIDADEFAKTVIDRVKEAETETQKLLKNESWDAQTALSALQSIEWLLANESSEAGNEAGQVSDLKAVVERLKSFIASEIMENTTEDESMVEKAAKTKAEMETEAEAQGNKAGGSEEQTKHVESIHKSAANIMHKCMKAMGEIEGGDAEKVAKAMADVHDHLAVIHSKAVGITKSCMKLGSKFQDDGTEEQEEGDTPAPVKKSEVVENEPMAKAVGEMTEIIKTMQARIDQLEKQPAPRKGALYAPNEGRHEVQKSGDKPAETVTPAINLNALRLSPAEMRSLSPWK